MKIFISYRRDDSAGYAGRLFDHLTDYFGPRSVFMDIAMIEPGEDFRKVVQNAVGTCDVVLAMIGKQWLGITNAQGQRRLDDPKDWVRVEIASALANSRVRVIPVLVREAPMPGTHELPDDIKELSWRNAIELSDNRFQYDANELIKVIERAGVKPTLTPPVQSPAAEFFRDATRLNLIGQVDAALQLYRRVKQIDPFYPEIDLAIRNIEEEIKKGQVDRRGHINEEILKRPPVMTRNWTRSGTIVTILTVFFVVGFGIWVENLVKRQDAMILWSFDQNTQVWQPEKQTPDHPEGAASAVSWDAGTAMLRAEFDFGQVNLEELSNDTEPRATFYVKSAISDWSAFRTLTFDVNNTSAHDLRVTFSVSNSDCWYEFGDYQPLPQGQITSVRFDLSAPRYKTCELHAGFGNSAPPFDEVWRFDIIFGTDENPFSHVKGAVLIDNIKLTNQISAPD